MDECRIRDSVAAVTHIQRVDASQMDECRIRDRGLAAVTHIQRVDALQMDECRIRDRGLAAATHPQCMHASQMDECRIRDCGLATAAHVQGTNPAEEDKIIVIQITSIDDVCCRGARKTSAPHFQATADHGFGIVPSVMRDGIKDGSTNASQGIHGLRYGKQPEDIFSYARIQAGFQDHLQF
jgi:hypothetical protein